MKNDRDTQDEPEGACGTAVVVPLTETQLRELRDVVILHIIDSRERCLAAEPNSAERETFSRRYLTGHELLEAISKAKRSGAA